MNELALFAGGGGGILGGKLLGWRTVCAVEVDPYRREILLRRQEEGILEPFQVWDDVRTFDGRAWRGKVDIVTAGFPCQPFSVAGRRRGADDERNLWPETVRVLGEVRSPFALLENSPRIVSCGYIATILGDLAEIGYDARWCRLGADDIGANHRRKRWWCLAYAQGDGPELWTAETAGSGRLTGCGIADVAYAPSGRREPQRGGLCESNTAEQWRGRFTNGSLEDREIPDSIGARLEKQQREPPNDGAECTTLERKGDGGSWWSLEPGMGRVVDGLAYRVDRIAALGDGQVPGMVPAVWRLLCE